MDQQTSADIKPPVKASVSDTNKIAKSGAFTGMMQFFQLGLRYLYALAATRIFGASNFGIFVLARTVSEFTSLFTGFGLHQGLMRHVPHYSSKNEHENVSNIISYSYKLTVLLSLSAAAIIFLSSNFIATRIFNEPELSLGLKYISIAIPFLTMIKIYYAVLRGFKSITKRVIIENGILPFLLVINVYLFSFIKENYLGLIFAYLAANIETTIAATFLVKKFHTFRIKSKLSPQIRKDVINYSWPLLLSSSIDYLQKFTDTLMLGILSSAYSVGIYTVAFRISVFIAVPLASFNMLFSPLIAEIYALNDLKRLNNNYTSVTKLTLTTSLPILGVILLFPAQLLHIFGKGFESASMALVIISLGQLINVGVGATGPILIMTGNQRINLLNSIFFLFVTIISNLILIPLYGVVGAGIANCISLSGLNIVQVIQVKKYINIFPLDKSFIKPISSFLISFLLIFIVLHLYGFQAGRYLLLISGSILFVGIYVLLLKMFGFEEYEKVIIRKISKKLPFRFKWISG
jgi:O-antigen/teichoic acid export membrane protein